VATCEVIERPAVLDVVASLVDKSLLQVDISGVTARYRMLETVRAYGARKLGGVDEQSARAAHAIHFLHLVEVAHPHFSASGQLEWRLRLEEDDDNLRSAFAGLIATPALAQEALRFGAAVSRFWISRGFYGDEVDLLAAALERRGAEPPTPARGAALAAGGYLMFRRGDTARAGEYLAEAKTIADTLGSASLRADALRTMAWVADRRGDHDAAIAFAVDAVEAAEASGATHLLARAYDVRAAASQHSDPSGARADYAEALRHCRSAGDGLGQASALNNLAILDLEHGDIAGARTRFAEALSIAEAVRDAALVPFLAYGVGLAAALDHDYTAAEPAFVNALLGSRRTGQRSLVAYALLGISTVCACSGRDQRAAVLLGASSALFEALGEKPETIEAAMRERVLADLGQAMGDGLDTAIDEGRRLDTAEVVQSVVDGL